MAQMAMLRECWLQVLLARPVDDTAPPDNEMSPELAVLAQSVCKGHGRTESALDRLDAQLEVSHVLGVMLRAGRLKSRCARFFWLLIPKHAPAAAL